MHLGLWVVRDGARGSGSWKPGLGFSPCPQHGACMLPFLFLNVSYSLPCPGHSLPPSTSLSPGLLCLSYATPPNEARSLFDALLVPGVHRGGDVSPQGRTASMAGPPLSGTEQVVSHTEGTLGTWSSHKEYGPDLEREMHPQAHVCPEHRGSPWGGRPAWGSQEGIRLVLPHPSSFLMRPQKATGPECMGEPLPFPSVPDLPWVGQWLTPPSPPSHRGLPSSADTDACIDLCHSR